MIGEMKNEKIKNLTGWRPAFNLDLGLQETVEWFKKEENLKRYKADIYNI